MTSAVCLDLARRAHRRPGPADGKPTPARRRRTDAAAMLEVSQRSAPCPIKQRIGCRDHGCRRCFLIAQDANQALDRLGGVSTSKALDFHKGFWFSARISAKALLEAVTVGIPFSELSHATPPKRRRQL
jgi:hypothetical protein